MRYSGAPELRRRERLFMVLASTVLLVGAWLVYRSLVEDFRETEEGYTRGMMVDLGSLTPGDLAGLDRLLGEGHYVTDPDDRAVITRTLAKYLAEGGSFPNVGRLNTRDLRVSAEIADSLGGPLYRDRVASSRSALGFTKASYERPVEALPNLPAISGELTEPLSLSGTIHDEDGNPMPGVLVSLTSVPPFYADSLRSFAVRIDTVATGVRGRAVIGTDASGASFTYVFTDTVRTDTGGRYAWHGLEEGVGYSILPLKPRYEFGSRKGTVALGYESLFSKLQALNLGAPAFDFVARPHRIPLLDRFTYSRVKQSALTARTPGEFKRSLIFIFLLFFGPFYLIHAWWTLRRFEGDPLLLPIAHMLSGLSLLLMIGMPDPLKDRFLAWGAATGIAVGVVLLGIVGLSDVASVRETLWRRFLGFVPDRSQAALHGFWMQGFPWLLAALGTAGLVLLLGYGPEGSGAKVNLFGFQPSEAIKLLMVLFFASYLTQNADFLRRLDTRRRLFYSLGIAGGIVLVLGMYALQGDLGPALVITLTLIVLWGIVRAKWLPIVLGVFGIAGGFVVGGLLVPRVYNRISMFLDRWDNQVYGGDHLAHALWTLSTGGLTGQGLGEGNAYTMPEAHTDMVLPSLGEEIGLIGMVAIFLLFAILLHRGFLIALRTGRPFGFFLGIGVVIATGLQLFLIGSGAFGLLPLTGLSAPLLSYGKSATIINFLVLGILLSLSARRGDREQRAELDRRYSNTVVGAIPAFFVLFALLVGRLVYVQVIAADDTVIRPALVSQRSGLRAYTYNPRIGLVRNRLPAGTIFDRNGIPLATSDTSLLGAATDNLEALEVDPRELDALRVQRGSRYYPFGDLTFYMLGDANTRLKWGSKYLYGAEYKHLETLRGFDNRPERVEVRARLARPFHPSDGRDTVYTALRYDYSELRPLVTAGSNSLQMSMFESKNRDVRLTLDMQLQQRIREVIERKVINKPSTYGNKTISVVALDAGSSELLASVTYPLPDVTTAPDRVAEDEAAFDHALYVRRHPGSTLKIATAAAAFMKHGISARDTVIVVRPRNRVDPEDPGFRLRRDEASIPNQRGEITMEKAIVRSSNTYFRRLASEQDLSNELLALYEAFGITVGYDTWPERERRRALQRDYELRWVAMGEGLANGAPLQVAHLASMVANEGSYHPVRFVLEAQGRGTTQGPPGRFLTPEQASVLDRYLAQVRGNSKFPLPSIGVAGKTGTANWTSDILDGWYVGYAPTKDGTSHLVVCVLIEEGRSSSHAAELAYDIFSRLHSLDYTKPRYASDAQ